ncbi:hypothetical protein [Pseudonocardia humida]|uniref:Integral membrane protein n=1 Tax=Pseudonocardia humida TaxID=2800819 RepID=A0ABT0ZYC7_9PSEU|nr:hypothetical protein [Pseudonocardia humida]MCO1655624.1 hypothetical protein [Pseudonocardia humida]
MSAPTPGAVRRLRSAAFAVSAVGLAVGAHVTAGGALPALPLVVGLVALVEASATAMARRRRGTAGTAAGLVVAQALLHFAFAADSPHAGHGHMAHGGQFGGANAPTMLAAHALAAVVLGFLLSHGDRMAEWAVGLLVPIAVVAPFRPRASVRVLLVAPVTAALGRWVVGLHDVGRRGPPRAPAAVRA